MEEDIMILESECYYLEELGYLRENNHFIRFNQALKNLIKGYRDSENIMEDAVKENLELKKYIRELEESKKEYKKVNENLWYMINEIQVNSIPKSKIKEKIEELETKLKVFEKDIRYCKDRVQARLMNDEIYVLRRCMDLLKELMEE